MNQHEYTKDLQAKIADLNEHLSIGGQLGITVDVSVHLNAQVKDADGRNVYYDRISAVVR